MWERHGCAWCGAALKSEDNLGFWSFFPPCFGESRFHQCADRLAGPWTSGILLSLPPSALGTLIVDIHYKPSFTWVLWIWTQVLILAQHALCPLSCPHSPDNNTWIQIYYVLYDNIPPQTPVPLPPPTRPLSKQPWFYFYDIYKCVYANKVEYFSVPMKEEKEIWEIYKNSG